MRAFVRLSALLVFSLFTAQAAFAADPAPAAPDLKVADPSFADHVIGDPKAPVRIDEFGMLTCPHCAEFAKDILPKLKTDYIDTGKVKLVFHDVVTNEVALKASVLAHCVPPDRFLGVVDTLYRTQDSWVTDTVDASLVPLRQQFKFAGLSDDKINACLADKVLETNVLKSTLDATSTWKITGTPTFVFNNDANKMIVGTKTYDDFKQHIDSLLP